ncbi:MAG: DNA polymerase III subunit delta [Oscillospiraceae bacterium]|nr:DNA polymerase III subunit delta [Oscillospiraceae bacterium]
MAKKQEETLSPGAKQLKEDLKQKNPGRFYVIYGEEDYLCRYYFTQLRKLLLDDLTGDFNFHKLTVENFSVELLNDSLETLPMMADRSLIQVDEVDFFALDSSAQEQIITILQDLPEHCCLVLTYLDFKPDKRKKKLWDTIEKHAQLAEFRHQGDREVSQWINRHFRELGKTIQVALCDYLRDLCNSSMTRLEGEIRKICDYSGAQEIVRADIDAVVEPTLEGEVFNITDALSNRDFDRAMERLHVLFKMRMDAIPIVAAIGSQMQRLYGAKILKNADELVRIYSLSPKAAPFTMTHARRFSQAFCEKAVILCRDADKDLKSSREDSELIVERLILQLAQEAQHD